MKNEHVSTLTDYRSSRRKFIAGAAALLPVALAGKVLGADNPSKRKQKSNTLPPPKYTIAFRLPANFARQHKDMPVDERFNLAASLGAK